MIDPLIHVPLYLDEWHARISGYDYMQRGAFITLFIAYVKSCGKLTMEGNNSALFRACGAITEAEQKSLIEIYKEVKNFADPRIKTQEVLREKRRNNAKLGGVAKGLAHAKSNAIVQAEQKISKRSAKSESESELESEVETEQEKKEKDNGLQPILFSPVLDDTYSFERVFKMYREVGNIKTAKPLWEKLPKYKKDLALQAIPIYILSIEPQYIRAFEKYIKKESWNDKILTNKCQADADYKPARKF